MRRTIFVFAAAALHLALFVRAAGAADQTPSELLFTEKCAGCHSIGKGDRSGPDLKGAHERRDDRWLFRMIKTPEAMLASDADAKALLRKYNVRMTELGLTDAETDSLIELIKRCSPAPDACNLAGAFVPVGEATAEDLALGGRLFLGQQAFEAGGPPCVSCHSVDSAGTFLAGGTLAVSLTTIYGRTDDEALATALRSPAFPLMKDIYKDRKLTSAEVLALRAFLYQANKAKVAGATETYSQVLPGILAALLVLVLLNAFWSRRLRGVRKLLAPTRTQGSAS